MKKLILLSILLASRIYASPFLVCTPVPASTGTSVQPTSYTISGLSASVTTAATVNPDGSVQLHYDLAAVPNGTYTVTVTAANSAGTSAPSAPFTFTLPLSEIPASPNGLSLSPK